MNDLRLAVLNQSERAQHEHAVSLDAQLVEELQSQIDGEVRADRHDRMLYATDASIYQVEPLGVVIPRHLDDVRAAVRFAAKHHLPLLPRGGGTSLAGQAVNRALVIDLSRHCNHLLHVDESAKTASIECGIVLDHLNDALAPRGLMFGPDVATAAHANVGGMIGNNSSGAHSVVYGRTVEHLRWLDVLLADGVELRFEQGAALRDQRVAQLTRRVAEVVQSVDEPIRQRFPKTRRRVDGYNLDLMLEQIERSDPDTLEQVNLAHLICGSEGTLAVTLRAGLDLVPVPKMKGLAIVAFDGVAAALASVTALLETGPSAIELIDDVIIELALRNNEYRRYVELLPRVDDRPPKAVLYVEYFADDEAQLRERFEVLGERFGNHRISAHDEPAAMARAWKLRKAGEPLLYGMPGERKPITFIEDTAVDAHKLVAFVERFRDLLDRHGTTASYYAHASVGCLHIRPLIALSDPDDRQTMQRIVEDATDLVREFGGALSGEHGDGRLRSHLLERFFGPEICDAFRKIKDIFDPGNRLNPGNIVQPAGMVEHLRVKPNDHDVRVPDVRTYFRYRAEGSFQESVKLCNGAGVCRKIGGGTMCPSYWATRDERHATRGRGNALRLAITGQLDGLDAPSAQPKWNDNETLRTLDLCLSCKTCKSECPSNVDVARMKSEYLAQSYHAGRDVPLQVQAFSRVRAMNRMGSAMHPLANALSRFGPLRSVANNMLSLAPQRSLPRFGPSLYRWNRRRETEAHDDAPTVILFPDCFSVYSEPHIGRAAIAVLEALGYRVVLPKLGCCGRPGISLGLLDRARIECRDTADALIAVAQREQAVAVVGLEPSCVSAIVDDWLDLTIDVDQPALHELAAKTMGVEDFIATRWNEHPNRVDVNAGGDVSSPVVLHGHCHQKALWGMHATVDVLQRILGDRLHVLDTGCCGMAGSFGYTADHYDVSMAVAESSLLPALREHAEATVLAPGTSCRHQVQDAMGREALHPIELIAEQMRIATKSG